MSKLSKIVGHPENPESLALGRQQATSFIRKLSGFPGYPQHPTGEEYFIVQFEQMCVSLRHAEAVIAVFDSKFPTLREFRDAAFNLRPQFEISIDQRKEWERQYGRPRPFTPEEMAIQRKEESDARPLDPSVLGDLVKINHKICEHLGIEWQNLQKVSLHRYFKAWSDLGYPMTKEQRQYL